MSTRANVRLISFCMFLILAMLTLSATLIYSAGFQDLESYMTIEFEAEKIKLNFANNEGSNVNGNTCSVVYNADKTKFKIVGAVPIIENDAVTNLSDLTATSGAEFYYFGTNQSLTDTTYYKDPGKMYYTSTADDTLENWYDIPQTLTNLYSCFMKPNCYKSTTFIDSSTVHDEYNATDGSLSIRFSNEIVNMSRSFLSPVYEPRVVIVPQSVKIFNRFIDGKLSGVGPFILPTSLEKIEYNSMNNSEIGPDGCYDETVYYAGTLERFIEICGGYNKLGTLSPFCLNENSETVTSSATATVYTLDKPEGEQFLIQTRCCFSLDTEITCYDEKRKRWYKKKLRDLTYKDKIVVWNFDEGKFDTAEPIFLTRTQVATRYTVVKLSDGAVLKLIGEDDSKRHRMFVKETGRFDYVNKSLIGKTTFNEKGEFVKILGVEYVNGEIDYANIITKYHFNCFANGILTSCRLSNMYKIKDMKYVKDNREFRPISDFKGVEEKYYDGLRLAEQPVNVCQDIVDSSASSYVSYIDNLINLSKKCE